MIYTVTFNPSIDYIMKVPQFISGNINRSQSETVYPGGKGINVSIMLSNLGIKSRALGFTAGFTGSEIERMLQLQGCDTDFIRISHGMSRINVKIKTDTESDINGQGPSIDQTSADMLFSKLDSINDGDIIVLAGSIPKDLPNDIYEKILEKMSGRNITAIVDATGELLLNVLKYRPFLIKPNNFELAELFGKTDLSKPDIILYAKELQNMGARNILVSMGGDGAILVTEAGAVLEKSAPEGQAVNTVGAGDSMVAGFIKGWFENGSYENALKMGIAAGSASAFSEWLASNEQIYKIYNSID